jgi:hypothetical protein
MGESFVPPNCRGVVWDGEQFGERIEAIPLYPTGFGSPIVLDEANVTTLTIPPSTYPGVLPHEPKPWSVGCTVAQQRPSKGGLPIFTAVVSACLLAAAHLRRARRLQNA